MPKVALSMIVKDASGTLRECIESVRGVADEIVIADTGSSDSTIKLAGELGARVIEIPWENDFSASRNRCLAELTADWVLFLDADEILDPEACPLIPRVIAASDIAGYQVTIRNYVRSLDNRIWDEPAKPNDSSLPAAKDFPAYVEHENVRLFRRDPRIYFVGRVHETVGSRIEECRLGLGRAPFLIHHFGLADKPEIRASKNRLYHRLGKLKVADSPRDAQAHFELGLVELDNMGNVEEALECFERAGKLNPHLGVSWFFAGVALIRLGRFREALIRLQKADKSGRATAATAEMQGDAHYNLAEFGDARRAYLKALRLSETAAIESKLGLASVRAGSVEQGLRHIRHAISLNSEIPELHDRLIAALVWLKKLPEAALAAEDKIRAVVKPAARDFARAGSLWAKCEDWAKAAAIVQIGTKVWPDDESLTQMLATLSRRSGSQQRTCAVDVNSQTVY